ncbi:MAG TPA: 4-(cytidine 5'-diphospho)-2-C-methyl-D-erythritol kinase [Panacibacter sp.]|nr:4-(cytidine 5'-diphospho)-2-C-methyl-D-erythritol kinase [Panacibacter sp.]
MVFFPNCKINLGLNIISKRDDGYHNLETVFYPLNITDAVEVINDDKPAATQNIQFSSSGIKIDGTLENNLCVKAYQLLKKDFSRLPAIKMHLLKNIPIGAGLGGGSADGAFTLLLLNKKCNLNLSTSQLISYAQELGSDCPFFITGKPSYAQGRGEILEQIDLNLSAYKFCIINPDIHINTSWAFAQIKPAGYSSGIKQIIQQPVETWKYQLINDFEVPVLQHYPQLQFIKDELYKQGAVYATMSGSGSTFIGIFDKEQKILTGHWPLEYYVKEVLAV